MPKFYRQNKKRIDPRYFLEETRHRDELIQLNESMEVPSFFVEVGVIETPSRTSQIIRRSQG